MDPSKGQPIRSQGPEVRSHDSPDHSTSKRSSIVAASAVQEGRHQTEVDANGSFSRQPDARDAETSILSSPGCITATERRRRSPEAKVFVEGKIVDAGSSSSATVGRGSRAMKAPTMLPTLTPPVMSPAPDSPKEEESPDDDVTPIAQEHHTQLGEGRTCINCRRSKVKCDKGSPCSRCARLKLECVAQTRGRGRPVASHKKTKMEPASPGSAAGAGDIGGGGVNTERPLVSISHFMGGLIGSSPRAMSGISSPPDLGRGAQLQPVTSTLGGVGPSRGCEDGSANNSFNFTGEIPPHSVLTSPSQTSASLSTADACRDGNPSLEPDAAANNAVLAPQHQSEVTRLVSPHHGHVDAFEAPRSFPPVMPTMPTSSASARTAGSGMYGVPSPRSQPLPLPVSSEQATGNEHPWEGIMNGVAGAAGVGVGVDTDPSVNSNSGGGESESRQASNLSSWGDIHSSSVPTASRGVTGVSSGSNSGEAGANGSSKPMPGGSNSSSATNGYPSSCFDCTTMTDRRNDSSTSGAEVAGCRSSFTSVGSSVGSSGGGQGKRDSLTAGLHPDGSNHRHQQCPRESLPCVQDPNSSEGDGGLAANWLGAFGHGEGGTSGRQPDMRREESMGKGGGIDGLLQRSNKRLRRSIGIELDPPEQQQQQHHHQQSRGGIGGPAPSPTFSAAGGTTGERGSTGRNGDGKPANSVSSSSSSALQSTVDPTDTIVNGFWRLFNGQEVNRPKAVMVIRHWALCALDRRSKHLMKKTAGMARALCINVGEILNDYSIYNMFHELLREAEAGTGTPTAPTRNTSLGREFQAPPYIRDLSCKIAAVSMRLVVRGQSHYWHNEMCDALFMSSEAANHMYTLGKQDVWATFIHRDDHQTFFESMSLQLFHVPGHFSESTQVLKCVDRDGNSFLSLVHYRYEFQDGGNYAAFGLSVHPLPNSPYLLNPVSRENGHGSFAAHSPLSRPAVVVAAGSAGGGVMSTSAGMSAGVGTLGTPVAPTTDADIPPSLMQSPAPPLGIRHGVPLPSLNMDTRRIGRSLPHSDVWMTATHPSVPPPRRNIKQGDVQLPPPSPSTHSQQQQQQQQHQQQQEASPSPSPSPSSSPSPMQQQQQAQHRAWADVGESDVGVVIGSRQDTVQLADGVNGMATAVTDHALGGGSDSGLRQDESWTGRVEPTSRMRFDGDAIGARSLEVSVMGPTGTTAITGIAGVARSKLLAITPTCHAFSAS